jgi:hypothetical protein
VRTLSSIRAENNQAFILDTSVKRRSRSLDEIRLIVSLFPRFAVPGNADYEQHKGEDQAQRGGQVT